MWPKSRKDRTDRKKVTCKYCGESFNTDYLQQHIKTKHGAIPTQQKGEQSLSKFFVPLRKKLGREGNGEDKTAKKICISPPNKPEEPIYENIDLPKSSDSNKTTTEVTKKDDVQKVAAVLQKALFEVKTMNSVSSLGEHLRKYEPEIARFKELCQAAILAVYTPLSPISEDFQSSMPLSLRAAFKVITVKADGNCFYSTVSYSLFGVTLFSEAIRVIVLHEIIRFFEDIEDIATIFGTNLQDMISRVKNLDKWANEGIIFCTSEVMKRPIIIIQSHRPGSTSTLNTLYSSDPSKSHLKPMRIMFKGSHFQPMLQSSPDLPFIDAKVDHPNIAWKYKRITDEPEFNLDDFEKYMEQQGEDYQLLQDMHAANKEATQGHLSSTADGAKSPDEFDSLIESDVSDDMLKMEDDEQATAIPTYLNKQLAEIKTMLQSIVLTKSTSTEAGTTETLPTNAKSLKSALIQCSLLNDLLQFFPQLDVLETRFDDDMAAYTLVCKACYNPTFVDGSGIFNVALPAGNTTPAKQSDSFRNLKKHINRHFKGKTHLARTKLAAEGEKKVQTIKSKNRLSGMICGTFAYTAVKIDANILRYERYCAILHSLGIDVGDINHGEDFCRKFTNALYTCLYQRLDRTLNTNLVATDRPVPLAIIADKYRPQRLTLQIVGIVTFIQNKIQALLLDADPVTDWTAKGLASALMQSLKKVLEQDLSTRVVGCAFDGEYIIKGVPRVFTKDHLNIEDADAMWISAQWDPAHIIELAIDSAKQRKLRLENGKFTTISNQSKIGFPKTLMKIISAINHSYGFGKNYVKIREESNYSLKAPLQFAATRFAAYTLRSLTNFDFNFPYFFDALNDSQDDDLHSINNVTFVFTLNAAIDIFDLVSRLSLQCQVVDTLPWRLYDAIDATMQAFSRVLEYISRKQFSEPCGELSRFGRCYRDMTESTTGYFYKDMPLLFRWHEATSSPNAEAGTLTDDLSECAVLALKDVHDFVEKFCCDLKYRLAKQKPPIFALIEPIFRTENVIAANSSGEISGQLWEYATLAMRQGHLPDNVTKQYIYSQYARFASHVAQYMQHFPEPNKIEKLEYEFYCRLCSKKSEDDIGDILHLLLTAMVRTHCESVAESMGNVVKYHAATRAVKPETVSKEIFIHWNGPQPEIAKQLVSDALDLHFSTNTQKDWNFHRISDASRLKPWFVSKVVDRVLREARKANKIAY